MEWLAGYIVIISGILTVGGILDGWLDADPELKRRLAQVLGKRIKGDVSSWLLAISDTFLRLFDRLYGRRRTRLEEFVWAALIGTLLSILWTRSRGDFILGTPEQLPVFLIGASIGAVICALLRIGVHSFLGARYVVLQSRFTILGLLLVAISAAGTVISTNIVSSSVLMDTARLVVNILLFSSFALAIMIVTVFVPVEQFPVDPFKAVASSLLFIILVGLIVNGWIQTDLWDTFWGSVTYKLSHLGFITFNIYADSFSLLETRWVLRRGANAGVRVLLELLVLDIIASAAIFLFLPATLGGIDIMREAVMFQGTRPWIGVLFWSTFATSIIFYLYVVAAFIVRPLARLAQLFAFLSGPFDSNKHPVRVIAIAMAVVITLGFTVIGTVNALISSAHGG